MIRWIGFVFIIAGAVTSGMYLSLLVRRTLRNYEQLMNFLVFAKGEICFKLTPLPDICGQASKQLGSPLSDVFRGVKDKLTKEPGISVGNAMKSVLRKFDHKIPTAMTRILQDLFLALGDRDVKAQTAAIECAEERTKAELKRLEKDSYERSRNYRTIAVFTGIAVAIILI